MCQEVRLTSAARLVVLVIFSFACLFVSFGFVGLCCCLFWWFSCFLKSNSEDVAIQLLLKLTVSIQLNLQVCSENLGT